ncbi:N-6 DNA methylase [Enterococcus mediterraneensis]|uniref:N-6 DNA methylase n=1 Tax=Enterococcus mediterraneensis TaxID=2364791 RepID=UPI0013E09350|nr:N-6 DNA methylase [Enterococcus mediterraneensis]
MLTTEKINELLEINESYEAPHKMLMLLMDDETRDKLFLSFLENESDLSYEWFQHYFEAEHADRKVKKQDFTPNSVSKLSALLVGKADKYFEATAGTGGMMIQFWNENPAAFFEAEELSDRAIPFLLFNMAIRNMDGIVRHMDSLSGDLKATYFLNSTSNRFSMIRGELYERTNMDGR